MSLMENSAGLGGRIRYFLGANTPTGFVGYTDDLYDCRGGWRAFLIKSGPGTGKNTLMRAVLDAMTAHGEEAQTICCSSDPHSLDATCLTGSNWHSSTPPRRTSLSRNTGALSKKSWT